MEVIVINIGLSKNEIEALLIGLRLANYELGQHTGFIFDYDNMTLRDANLNKLYSKLSETLYLNEHLINKLK